MEAFTPLYYQVFHMKLTSRTCCPCNVRHGSSHFSQSLAFLRVWVCRKLNYVLTKSTFIFLAKTESASGNRVFSFFLFLPPAPSMLFWFLCVHTLHPPAFGNCEVAKFFQIWGPMPSYTPGFDGWAFGYWDMIHKALSEAISQSHVTSWDGTWQPHCIWMPGWVAFSLESVCPGLGPK